MSHGESHQFIKTLTVQNKKTSDLRKKMLHVNHKVHFYDRCTASIVHRGVICSYHKYTEFHPNQADMLFVKHHIYASIYYESSSSFQIQKKCEFKKGPKKHPFSST